MSMRVLSAVTVVLLVLAACNQSQVDPEADVSIEGTVQRQDGTTVGDARVALMKEASAGDVFLGVASIGLVCLESEISVCGEQRVTTTAGDGSFAYDLKGSDVQGSFGGASIMELTTALARGSDELAGPGVNTRFQVQTEAVRVPLRAWESPVEMTGAGGDVRVTWSDPPGDVFPAEADLGDLTRRVVFRSGPRETVWEQSAPMPSLELDARVLEDTRGDVAVFSEVDDIMVAPQDGTDVEVLLRSARYGYASPAGQPPSRGASCSVPGPDGQPVSQTPCTLTDGGFSEEFRPATCPPSDEGCVEPDHTRAVVDLGSPIDVDLVVVRGCSGTCSVEVSEDRATWQPVGASAGELGRRDVIADAAEPVRGRYVRVASDERVDTLREMSVWDGQRPSLQGSLLVSPDEVSSGLLPDRDGGDGGGSSLWFIGALLVAFLAIGVAVGLAVRRRGRQKAGTSSASG